MPSITTIAIVVGSLILWGWMLFWWAPRKLREQEIERFRQEMDRARNEFGKKEA